MPGDIFSGFNAIQNANIPMPQGSAPAIATLGNMIDALEQRRMARDKEAQAQANKSIAQAQAEIRRAAAVALEQEMKARVQEMQAKVVEAQAQVPLAMAEAFRSGRLGVMDYYKMENIQSDTAMRSSIANPEGKK